MNPARGSAHMSKRRFLIALFTTKPVRCVSVLISLAVAISSVNAGEAGRVPLKSGEISKALVGKEIGYNPPGWADTAIAEEFYPDGKWGGMLAGRGPVHFSGRWSIDGGKMCVMADRGTIAERWHPGRYCRQVWRDRASGKLLMDYLPDQAPSRWKMGLQVLSVQDLPAKK